MLQGRDETPEFCQLVTQHESDADNITRQVLTAVRRTFITPFDRVDIKNLITSMDDAIDQMEQTAKAVMLFEVEEFEQPMREIGRSSPTAPVSSFARCRCCSRSARTSR